MNDPKSTDAISRSELIKNPREWPEHLGVLHNPTCEEYAERHGNLEALSAILGEVERFPALDVAPVVHAHWIKTFGSDGFVSTLRCSKCGNAENSTYIPGNFCWFCGAKMDGDSE